MYAYSLKNCLMRDYYHQFFWDLTVHIGWTKNISIFKKTL